jgi:RNA polymerase sigma factor (sigma-70 family)
MTRLTCGVQLPTPITLTDEQVEQFSAVMRRGTLQLRECADKMGMQNGVFRAKLLKGGYEKWPGITAEQVMLVTKSLPAINEVRKLEDTLLAGHVRLIMKQAKSWSHRRTGSFVSVDDYIQESVMAFLDAFYAYSSEDAKFITFATTAIKNRCLSAFNRSHPLNPLGNQAIVLLQRFEQEKRRLMETVGPTNDEEVIQLLRVNKNEAEIIRASLVKVIHVSQSEPREQENINFLEQCADRCGGTDDHDGLYNAIKEAGLSADEHEALTKFMSEGWGWQSALAKERGMTRQNINLRVRNAIQKVKTVLLRKEAV